MITIETSPDKKMGVGSLHNPREYDGRLPPDAGYYLDLVLPRNEEPRKKTGGRVRLLQQVYSTLRLGSVRQGSMRSL